MEVINKQVEDIEDTECIYIELNASIESNPHALCNCCLASEIWQQLLPLCTRVPYQNFHLPILSAMYWNITRLINFDLWADYDLLDANLPFLLLFRVVLEELFTPFLFLFFSCYKEESSLYLLLFYPLPTLEFHMPFHKILFFIRISEGSLDFFM